MILKIITVAGAGVIIVSIFLLPWVNFLDAKASDQQIAQFLSDARIRDLLEQVPQLRQLLGIQRLATLEDVRHLFTNPELQKVFTLAPERQRLSGWALWHEVPRVNVFLRWSLLLAMILAAATVIWALFTLISRLGRVSRIGTLLYSVGALLVFLLVLWYVPTVDTFGLRDDFGLALVCLLTGSRTGSGIWVALLGLLMIAVAGGIQFAIGEYEIVRQEENNWEYGEQHV